MTHDRHGRQRGDHRLRSPTESGPSTDHIARPSHPDLAVFNQGHVTSAAGLGPQAEVVAIEERAKHRQREHAQRLRHTRLHGYLRTIK